MILVFGMLVALFILFLQFNTTMKPNLYVEPRQTDAYIIGQHNVTMLVHLHQPAVIRCLAGGYPKPIVTWWRGQEMLGFRNIRKDHSYEIPRVQLIDLGPYVCQAYAGHGKGASITVTLKTIGPIRATNKIEEQYLKYVVSPPRLNETTTQRPQILRPTKFRPQPPPRPERRGKL